MSFASRARKTLAISTATLVVAAGLAVVPLAVSAASAASSTSSASAVLAKVNSLRSKSGNPKLLPNGFIKAYAAQYAAGMAKHKSISKAVTTKTSYPDDSTAATGLKVKVPHGTVSSVYAFMKKYIGSDMNDSDYNYGAIGWAKSGTSVYAVIVLFDYETAPDDLLTESTPVISGTAKVGGTLKAKTSINTTGATLSYQWKVGGVAAGTNASSYVPVVADLGKKVTVSIIASKTGYVTTASHGSAATKAVAKGTLTTVKPVVTGSRNVGSTLTATVDPWGPATVALSYKWTRSGKVISGATTNQYLQSAADLGKKINVVVTGTETGYNTTSVSTSTGSTTKPGVVM